MDIPTTIGKPSNAITKMIAPAMNYFFLAVDFLAGDFLAGAFFAGAFLAGAFFAGAFFAGAFFAGAFLAGAFLAGAFFAGAFFAGAFLAGEADEAAGADAVLTGTAVATGLAALFLFTARLMEVMNAFTTEKLPVHTRHTMDWTTRARLPRTTRLPSSRGRVPGDRDSTPISA